MTTPKDDVIVIEPGSPEDKAMLERMQRLQAERKAYLRKFGYTSGEGFIVGEDGVPRSLGEHD